MRAIAAFILAFLLCGCSGEESANPTASASPALQAAAESRHPAALAYLRFHQTLSKAKAVSELSPLLAAEPRAQLDSEAADAGLLAELQREQVKSVVVESVEGGPDRVSLRVCSGDGAATGTVVMLLEGKDWKLLEEDWEFSSDDA